MGTTWQRNSHGNVVLVRSDIAFFVGLLKTAVYVCIYYTHTPILINIYIYIRRLSHQQAEDEELLEKLQEMTTDMLKRLGIKSSGVYWYNLHATHGYYKGRYTS